MSSYLCSECVKVLASRTFQSSLNTQYHHPDMKSLVKSAETCGLCRIFLENISTKGRQAIIEAVDLGSYSKVVVCSGSLHSRLENVLGPGADLYIEINTRNRCFQSQKSLVLPPECEQAFFFQPQI